MGPNYVPGQKKDVYVQTVQHAVIWTPNKHELVNDAPSGNIVAVVGLDQFITKNATLTNGEEFDAYPLRAMKFSVSPIVLVAVQCKVASDFPKLVEGLRCLVKSDPIVRCTIEESGEHVIAGTGELHLKVCLEDLQGHLMDSVEITSSTPAVSFRETVLEKSCRAMIESPNKHNCLHMQAYPLATELTKAIDEGYIKPGDEHDAYPKMGFMNLIWMWISPGRFGALDLT
jgi:elongation factor 2